MQGAHIRASNRLHAVRDLAHLAPQPGRAVAVGDLQRGRLLVRLLLAARPAAQAEPHHPRARPGGAPAAVRPRRRHRTARARELLRAQEPPLHGPRAGGLGQQRPPRAHEYDEFKARINGLEHEIKQRSDAYNAARGLKDGEPRATWMADGSQWEGTVLVSFLQYCSLLLLFHSYTFLVR